MRCYQLHVKIDGAWSWVCTIDASAHEEAYRIALRCLGPADQERPIRIEQDTEGAYRKPFRPPSPAERRPAERHRRRS